MTALPGYWLMEAPFCFLSSFFFLIIILQGKYYLTGAKKWSVNVDFMLVG